MCAVDPTVECALVPGVGGPRGDGGTTLPVHPPRFYDDAARPTHVKRPQSPHLTPPPPPPPHAEGPGHVAKRADLALREPVPPPKQQHCLHGYVFPKTNQQAESLVWVVLTRLP